MAGTRININFEATAARQSLAGLLSAIQNPAPLLEKLGEYTLGSTRDRFKTQTAPDGSAWAALQPWYQRIKARNKNKTLTLDGYLRGQMTWQLDGKRKVEVGSNSPYAAVHQFGSDRPQNVQRLRFKDYIPRATTIPARPYLGLSDSDRNELVERTLDWLRTSGRM
jgi:phage virion morphogenesis protein